MKQWLCAGVLVLVGWMPAHAGPLTDELSQCLLKSTSDDDRTLFIQWIYAAMSSHPKVSAMSSITPEFADQLNRRAADLVTELLTSRCRGEATQAVKAEGEAALRGSFEVLGRVGMQGLMADPKVTEYLTGLGRYFDQQKLKAAFEEKEEK
jgi:hypothetical protein